MKKTKTIWRLANRPTPSEVTDLFKSELLTKDEAREILISLETDEDRTKKSLQDEVKFLRELVAKLTISRTVIIENIQRIEKPYKQYDWYQPYQFYCANKAVAGNGFTAGLAGSLNASNTVLTTTSGTSIMALNNQSDSSEDFKQISTF